MGIFDFLKQNRQSKEPETSPKPTAPAAKEPQPATPFYLEVCNKYSAYGGMFAEGRLEQGRLQVGDRVYVYDASGKPKYENKKVLAILDHRGISTNFVTGEDKNYVAIRLEGVQNIGDYDNKDVISTVKLTLEKPQPEDQPKDEKKLPEPKTYNDPDRRTHINMATNDISSMCASGSLASNREWVRNVGQDLYDAHGFGAMQEVFINVKTRYPAAQSQLSSIWDGVGGWAD